MTRENDILSETFSGQNQNKDISIFAMWCKNCDLFVLGDALHDCYENDDIKKQCKHPGEGLGDST